MGDQGNEAVRAAIQAGDWTEVSELTAREASEGPLLLYGYQAALVEAMSGPGVKELVYRPPMRIVYVPAGGLPAGTLPGARDPATGFPYWLPVTEPSRAFDIPVDNNGRLTAGQNILNRLTGVPYKLLANLAGSTFNLPFSAPSADMTFRITKLNSAGSGGQIGTILFKAGSTVGAATLTETAFAAGDVLLVNAPDTASAQTTGAQFVIVGRGA